MKRRAALGALAAFAASAVAARADDPSVTSARTVVTHHTMQLANGTQLAYTATTGTLQLRNEHNEPTADVFTIAYTTGDRKRPVTFCYNGGPGSASLWLHLGAFGPRRIVMSQTQPIPPASAHVIDNPSTLLDVSDLVFIDPVGTGFSTVTGKGTDKDFWGVDEDLRAFSQLIRRWVATNDRGGSPRFLLGESYGTFRSAGLVDRLQKDGLSIDGVILLSTLLDYADDFGGPGDANVPDTFALPSEAAVAWYHKKVPDAPTDVLAFVEAARTFAINEYLPAVMRAQPLTQPQQMRLAQRLHSFIGLDPDYLVRANLRVPTSRFQAELLRDTGMVVGRYDGRYAGIASDRNAAEPQYDPSYEAVAPAFITAFTAYAKNELGWQTGRMYRALPGDVIGAWDFRRGGFEGQVLAPSVIPDLREAMQHNPALRIFSGNGLFDLATPFYATEYELAQVASDPAARARITISFYASGHMIYLDDDALHALRADLGRFYAGMMVR